MEQNRLWHEPVVEIYANGISPGVSCSASAYDLANRRWYELNVRDTASDDNAPSARAARPFQVPDDDWLSSTVAKHVSDCYRDTGSPPTWDIINTTSVGHPVTFEYGKSRDYVVGMPITERFFYGHKASDCLPTIGFQALTNKTYLSRGADYCDWKGQKCVFKRIEFNCDNESHEQEIRAREQLIQHMTQESTGTAPLDVGHEMLRRFNVVPVLAVVLHDDTSRWMVRRRPAFSEEELQDDEEFDGGAEDEERLIEAPVEEEPDEAVQRNHTVAGFITPYMGRSLELLGAADPTTTGGDRNGALLLSMPALGSPSTTVDVPVTVEQLLDLVKGVRELSRCGVTHGDICYWNIVLEESRHRIPATSSAGPRLLLIDMGDTAPDYENDAVALTGFLLWCVEHSSALRRESASRKKVFIASALLNEVDFDGAIDILSPVFSLKKGYEADSDTGRSHDGQLAKRRRL